MKDQSKTKQELLKENFLLKQKIHELEHSESERKKAELTLHRSEENFRNSFDDSPVGVRIVTEEGETIYANRAILDSYGYDSIEEIRTTPIKKRYTPESQADFLIRREKRQQGVDLPSEYTINIIRKDGEVRCLRVIRREIIWDGKRQFQVLYNDITERKEAEEALRQSEEKYRTLIENIQDGIYILDAFGNFTFVNDVIVKRSGFPAEWFLGRSYIDIIIEEDRERTQRYFNAVMDGKTQLYDLSYQSKSGNLLNVEVSTAPLFDGARVIALLGISRDISERKRLEKALVKSEKNFRQITENMVDCVALVDASGTYKYVTPSYREALGYGSEDMVDITGFSLTHPDDLERVLKLYMDGIEQGLSEIRYETRLRHRKGHYVSMEIRARSLKDTQGNIVGGVLAARDIMKRLQVDEERKRAEKTLLKSEANFRAMVDTIPLAIYLSVGIEQKSEYINPMFIKLFGYTLEDVLTAEQWWPLAYPDENYRREISEEWTARVKRAIETKSTIEPMEAVVTCKDGSKKNILWGYIALGEKNYAYGLDLTERKLAEEMLKEREARIQSIFRSAPIGIGVVSNRILLKVNDRMCEMIGYSEDELIGQSARIIYPSDEEFERVGKYKYDQIKKYGTGTIETHFLRKDGKLVDILLSSTPIDPNNLSTGVTFTALDITERKQSEEALKKQLDLFELITETSPVGITLVDSDGSIRFANLSAEKILGLTKDAITGRAYNDPRWHIVDESGGPFPEDKLPFFRVMNTGAAVYNVRHGIKWPDGRSVILSINAAPLKDDSDKVIGMVAALEDITERKRTEEELLKADKLESVGILAGGIAHDFNNILTSISGNISMAKMLVKPGDKISYLLSAAETSSIRAQGLTRQLLTFAKGGMPIKEIASIQKLIRESSFFVLQGSKSRCELQITEDLWPVETDTGQISQVISNMVINANQAMPEGGTIRITAENMMPENITEIPVEPGRYIRISIKDQGVGIAEKHLSKIFDPYFTTKQAGSGLGLATAYSIIKKHNGYISVDSIPGAGTTFAIYLPASDKEVPGKEESDLLTGDGKLLVMDDDRILREMMREMLEMLGYDAQFAKDGAEAIEMYRKAKESGKPYDVVILDLTIPGGMGGEEVIKILLEIDPEVKAVVFSGYSDDEVMLNFREYGFKGMMPKPFDTYALGKVLNDVLK